MEEKDNDAFRDGLIFGHDIPDAWCNAANNNKVDLIQQRAEFSKYLIVPTKFGFKKVVRIYAMVFTFIAKCKAKVALKKGIEVADNKKQVKFSMFQTHKLHIYNNSGIIQVHVSDAAMHGEL